MAAHSTVPLLEAEDVSVQYSGSQAWVLEGVSLTQLSGQVTAIVGPSGCGKSSLIHTLCGLIPHSLPAAYAGHVLLHGTEIADAPAADIATTVAYVGQNPDSTVVMPQVGREVCFALQNLCLPPREVVSRARWALEQVGLDHHWDDHPWKLSGGQRQRLALACALAVKPDLLILDEPTSMIDATGTASFYRLIEPLKHQGMAVVVIDHDLDPLLDWVDRVIALDSDGAVIAEGSVREVYLGHRGTLVRSGVWIPRAVRGLGDHPAPDAAVTCRQAGISLPDLSDWCGADEVVCHRKKPDGTWQREQAPAPAHRNNGQLVLDSFAVSGRCPAVTASFSPGEVIAVIGPNGAGKTTLLAGLAGLVPKKKTSGTATLSGIDVTDRAHRAGYVYQNPEHQYVTVTVEKEIAFGGTPDTRTSEIVEHFHLEAVKDHHPLTLSGGQSRRLSVATMAAHPSTLVCLDEPTYGQDWANTVELESFIRQLAGEGKIIVLATHDLELAARLADRIIALPGVEHPAAAPDTTRVDGSVAADSDVGDDVRLEDPPRGFMQKLHPLALAIAILPLLVLVVGPKDYRTNLAIVIVCAAAIAVSRASARKITGSIALLGLVVLVLSTLGQYNSEAVPFLIPDDGRSTSFGVMAAALVGLFIASGIAVNPYGLIREVTRIFHLPYRIGMAGIAALVFTTRLGQEFTTLQQARRLRGVGEKAGVFAPAVRWISSAVPLVISAIRHAERVSLSMDARAFGAYPTRTELVREHWRATDTVVVAVIWLAAAAAWMAVV
ncbi:ATP-binding cassette domain-containing protein [Corynebacterium mendelii]|uniref:ATP-binding cassette domain-containing protein n=1 Tax=Corynebacterium mendelii TaxID=2765362 RepID=A0A939DYP4_9CORY|nr:ATP-binding cassette domain-containing protein [Corynebacterium mendelii]